jgi:hypothetical protein
MSSISDQIVKVLTEFGKTTVPDLQSSLKSKLTAKSNKYGSRRNSSSDLANSIKFSFPSSGGSISFVLSMNEYGEAIDSGRVAAGVDAKGQENLIDWAKKHGIAENFRKKDLATRLANQRSGKGKSKKVLKKMPFENAAKAIAFLVGRKLKKKGFEGNGFFREIIKDGRVEELKLKLSEIIKSEIRIEVKSGLK